LATGTAISSLTVFFSQCWTASPIRNGGMKKRK
jgi:hypothetical protein